MSPLALHHIDPSLRSIPSKGQLRRHGMKGKLLGLGREGRRKPSPFTGGIAQRGKHPVFAISQIVKVGKANPTECDLSLS
ncbi:unnamed protein product [Nezara viridula]|uniref:Uncharacterized protein n=1 Tax=Nezara viridula TaxID=85310 RepID=A0A9P0HJ11_NEZVI|nr:unnamed protein product [Nezara viridula]